MAVLIACVDAGDGCRLYMTSFEDLDGTYDDSNADDFAELNTMSFHWELACRRQPKPSPVCSIMRRARLSRCLSLEISSPQPRDL